MPRHDFACPGCGTIERDVYRSIEEGAQANPPLCPCCGDRVMEWIPGIGRMSIFGEFAKTTIPVEDPSSPTGFRDVTISTLADIRRLERESEQAERNGEGRKMVWRDYSQDHSNTDIHTLGKDPSLTPSKFYSNGTPVKIRRGDPVIADHGEIEELIHESSVMAEAGVPD